MFDTIVTIFIHLVQEVVAPPELPVDVPEAELVVPPRPSEVLARLAEVSPPLDHLQQRRRLMEQSTVSFNTVAVSGVDIFQSKSCPIKRSAWYGHSS